VSTWQGYFHLASTACGTNTGAFPSLYDGMQCVDGSPILTSMHDIVRIVGNVVRILIFASGALGVIAIMAAAVYYIVSAGDAGRVKRAKDIMVNTTVGLVLVIISYAVVTFIASGF
jgi:hypothetical protein